MSSIREMLVQRHKEIKTALEGLQGDLADVEKALRALGVDAGEVKASAPAPQNVAPQAVTHSMPVNDAIIKAVEAGNKTPVKILKYLHDELGVMTTLNSVRARVSPLGKEGKIAHDGDGWVPAGTRIDDLLS